METVRPPRQEQKRSPRQRHHTRESQHSPTQRQHIPNELDEIDALMRDRRFVEYLTACLAGTSVMAATHGVVPTLVAGGLAYAIAKVASYFDESQ